MQVLQPPGWSRPRGYSNGIAATGRMVFVSGMIGWDANCEFQTDDFAGQVRQAMENILTVLKEAGSDPQHIVRMTWYVVDKHEYMGAYKEIGTIYRELIGNHYPAMTAVEVAGLLEARARVEIEVTAVVPA
jgi:enamine deaminase RidA (YjgF/YER057c/UK114 family)